MTEKTLSSKRVWWIAAALIALLLLMYVVRELWEDKAPAHAISSDAESRHSSAASKPESLESQTKTHTAPSPNGQSPEMQEVCEHGMQSLADGSPFAKELEVASHKVQKAALERMANSSQIEQRDMAESAAIAEEIKSEALHRDAACQVAKASCSVFKMSDKLTARVRSFAELSSKGGDAFGVYLAQNLCVGDRKCATDTALSLTEIDPNNGVAWLNLANILKQQGDLGGAIKALNQAAESKRFSSYQTRIHKALQPMESDYASKFEQVLAYQAAIGIAAAQPLPYFSNVSQLCKADSREVSSGALQCERLAEAMVNHSDDLITVSIGVGLLSKLKVTPNKILAANEKKDAFLYAMYQSEDWHIESPPYACETLPQYRRIMKARSENNEVQTSKNWLQSKGLSETQAAANYRAQRKQDAEDFQRENDERLNQAFKRPF